MHTMHPTCCGATAADYLLPTLLARMHSAHSVTHRACDQQAQEVTETSSTFASLMDTLNKNHSAIATRGGLCYKVNKAVLLSLHAWCVSIHSHSNCALGLLAGFGCRQFKINFSIG